jgi:hypothetical protein
MSSQEMSSQEVWSLQNKYPRGFSRKNEANCGEILIRVASSQEALCK